MITKIKQFKTILENNNSNKIKQYCLTIIDMASSGTGEVDFNEPSQGLVFFFKEIKEIVLTLSNQENKDLSDMLSNEISAEEGWTQGDIELLNNTGLSISKELDEDTYYEYL